MRALGVFDHWEGGSTFGSAVQVAIDLGPMLWPLPSEVRAATRHLDGCFLKALDVALPNGLDPDDVTLPLFPGGSKRPYASLGGEPSGPDVDPRYSRHDA